MVCKAKIGTVPFISKLNYLVDNSIVVPLDCWRREGISRRRREFHTSSAFPKNDAMTTCTSPAPSTIQRIVSVCPSNTELCAHLGVLDKVVGRDTWSIWPKGEVETIESVGMELNVNMERVVELQPDLILASLSVPGMEKTVSKFQDTGLDVVIYDPLTWQDVLDNLLDLGKRLGMEQHAKSVVAKAQQDVLELQQEAQDLPWIDLVIEWWPKPVIVPCGKTYVNDVLSWIHVQNPFDSKYPEHRSGQPTMEEIAVIENPDLYAVSWCGTPWSKYNTDSVMERYEKVAPKAKIIQEPKRIFLLWEGEISHPSLRLIDGARRVLKQRRDFGI